MTVTEVATAASTSDRTQVLFREARRRRRRRWLVSGIAVGTAATLLILTLGLSGGRGGNGSSQPGAHPSAFTAAAGSAFDFSLRPVLCYAPAANLSVGEAPSTGPLPECSPASKLTATNLSVNTATGATADPPEDQQFATYPDTPSSRDTGSSTVLLSGPPATGNGRFVLGPVG